jgi:phytochrome-interacting factor 4
MASLPRMPPFMAPPPAAVQSSPVVSMADPYARCLAVDHLQPPPPMVSKARACTVTMHRSVIQ